MAVVINLCRFARTFVFVKLCGNVHGLCLNNTILEVETEVKACVRHWMSTVSGCKVHPDGLNMLL